MRIALAFFIIAILNGCASMKLPEESLIDTVPLVRINESGYTSEDHILFIPADTEFPIRFSLRGTILNSDISSIVMASFKHDIYLYKYWASLDGKNWVNSHKILDVEPSGGFDKSGGIVEVKLDIVQ